MVRTHGLPAIENYALLSIEVVQKSIDFLTQVLLFNVHYASQLRSFEV